MHPRKKTHFNRGRRCRSKRVSCGNARGSRLRNQAHGNAQRSRCRAGGIVVCARFTRYYIGGKHPRRAGNSEIYSPTVRERPSGYYANGIGGRCRLRGMPQIRCRRLRRKARKNRTINRTHGSRLAACGSSGFADGNNPAGQIGAPELFPPGNRI